MNSPLLNSPIIKDWLELPEPVLLPLQDMFGNSFELVLQPLAVPCLWDLRIR